MGIMETDKWLAGDYRSPSEICVRFSSLFAEENPERLYDYLKSYGMYIPPGQTGKTAEKMKKSNIWSRAERIFNLLRKKWGGPDVPVFIFPLREPGFFNRPGESKSGLAFADKLFLFVHPDIRDIELKALLIHEYHHTCRLEKQKKDSMDYTLLDSMIMEGLAEYTVLKYTGKQGLAKWTSLYKEEELEGMWNRYLKDHAAIMRDDPLHDQLLLGRRPYPKMLGYCAGYYLVSKLAPKNIQSTFSLEADAFIKDSG